MTFPIYISAPDKILLYNWIFSCVLDMILSWNHFSLCVQLLQAPRSCPTVSPQKGMHFHVVWAVVGLEITTVSFIPTSHSPTYAKTTIPHTLHDHWYLPVLHLAMPHHTLPWCATSCPGSR